MEQKKEKVNQTNSEENIYIILNKKIGHSCLNNESKEQETIVNQLNSEDQKTNLFCIGKLDKEDSGLVILTNDSNLANNLIQVNSTIKKEYMITLATELTQIHKKQLEKGIQTEEHKFTPCSIKQLGNNYLIKINENTENQIKKMFRYMEYEVTSLYRTKMGKVNLQKSGLKPGKYKKIPKELLEKKILVN
jgi:pseudouridine synthase